MASKAYRQAASFAKKAAKPPAKTVVFSLMAFLIVAACPYLIIQTDVVVQDSLEISQDYNPDNFKIKSIKFGDQGLENDALNSYSIYEEIDNGYSFDFFVDNDLSSYSELSQIFYIYDFVEGESFDMDKIVISCPEVIHSVTLLVSGSDNYHFFGDFEIDEETSQFIYEFSSRDHAYLRSLGDFERIEIMTNVWVNENFEEYFPISMEIYSFEDDYTGSIIAFVAGIGLVVLAVLSTNLVNPTRWGKRRS